MVYGDLIETCEEVCWWNLGLRLQMIFFDLESVKSIYRYISGKIDVSWAVDVKFLDFTKHGSPANCVNSDGNMEQLYANVNIKI